MAFEGKGVLKNLILKIWESNRQFPQMVATVSPFITNCSTCNFSSFSVFSSEACGRLADRGQSCSEECDYKE